MLVNKDDVFGLLKPHIDANTLGINSVGELLKECGYQVILGDEIVSIAISNLELNSNKKILVEWITSNNITRIGLSYRLDEEDAFRIFQSIFNLIYNNNLMEENGGFIKSVYFAGLPKSCELIHNEFGNKVTVFPGRESFRETLEKFNVPEDRIPKTLIEGSKYDEELYKFAKQIIDSKEYMNYKPIDRSEYKEYGTFNDSIVKRLKHNLEKNKAPLIRAHVGPYFSNKSRIESVTEFGKWAETLASTKYLDILLIGSSQLSQSNFNEDWTGMINGGGVPINSPEEYKLVWEKSRPMLVRTYAGTKNIPYLAKMYDETINNAWHALSLWWINKLDDRGTYDLYTNLKQHIDTIKYIVSVDKPFELNVSHHFAFRGADDVTYNVSAYLAAKIAKKLGIRTMILQNMLNTLRYTWGIQDLAKSRVLLKTIKSLEDDNFKVILQPRAGLDYFSTDLNEAKIQLASVSALMDDIDPNNDMSPEIIHVVSYSEADHLATPEIINESIQITQYSIKKYRELRLSGKIEDMSDNNDINSRMVSLIRDSKLVINAIEENISNPYSAEGLYKVYSSGFLQTPYLWREREEFEYATKYYTKLINGSIKIVDREGNVIDYKDVIDFAIKNLHKMSNN